MGTGVAVAQTRSSGAAAFLVNRARSRTAESKTDSALRGEVRSFPFFWIMIRSVLFLGHVQNHEPAVPDGSNRRLLPWCLGCMADANRVSEVEFNGLSIQPTHQIVIQTVASSNCARLSDSRA